MCLSRRVKFEGLSIYNFCMLKISSAFSMRNPFYHKFVFIFIISIANSPESKFSYTKFWYSTSDAEIFGLEPVRRLIFLVTSLN